MPDVVPSVGEPAPTQDQKAVDSSKFVTVEQLDAITRQMNGLSAALRKITDRSSQQDPPAHQPAQDQPASEPRRSQADRALEAQMAAIKSEVEALKAREEKLKMRTLNALTREACTRNKASEHALEPLMGFVQQKYGARLQLDEDANAIFVMPLPEREALEGPKTLDDVLREYLASPSGSWALPAKQLPAAGSTDVRNFVQDGKHVFSGLTARQIKDHPDKRAFADYTHNHRAEWQAKLVAELSPKR